MVPFPDGREVQYALKFMPLNLAEKELHNVLYRIPRHPYIVRCYGYFPFDGHAVIGMEVCQGSLWQYLMGSVFRNLTVSNQCYARWYILQQMAEALHQCHLVHLIHRDVKPENGKIPIFKLVFIPKYFMSWTRKQVSLRSSSAISGLQEIFLGMDKLAP